MASGGMIYIPKHVMKIGLAFKYYYGSIINNFMATDVGITVGRDLRLMTPSRPQVA
jgi:hypothetical protein